MRLIHIVAGVLVGTVIYSPLRESDAFVLVVQIAIPVLTLTGISMWQQARLRRLFRRGDRSRTE